MLNFKKYNSIENVTTRSFMNRVYAEMPCGLEWVVQEKVHGTNTSFLCDGKNVKFAKRTSVLADDDMFYNFQKLLENYSPKVLSLFKRIKGIYSEVETISVFGEMFGGRYAHESVPAEEGIILIQKGVDYCPGHEFYGFDIYVSETDGIGRFLSVDEVNELFEAEGFFYAKTLFRGSLADSLKYPNAFQSKISQWLGLPDIEDNICEGIVIRPVEPQYFRNGSRVLMKSKNERFSEKKKVIRNDKVVMESISGSEAFRKLLLEVEAYITENRLSNVMSHIGEVFFPKDFGKVVGLFAKDVLDDFLKEHGNSYSNLDIGEQKSFNRKLNKLAAQFVKQTNMPHI